jgi:integrase
MVARRHNQLTAPQVRSKTLEPGMYSDGSGLFMHVGVHGGRSWIFRFSLGGKVRDMGLGHVQDWPLADARELAAAARRLVSQGIDPIEERKQRIAAARPVEKIPTFREAAERYIADHSDSWKSAKHLKQWSSSLETYAYPVIGRLPVDMITVTHVEKILKPEWESKTVTLVRVRDRIERILSAAEARGWRSGANPARWKGGLEVLLSAPAVAAKMSRKARGNAEHEPALPWQQLPEFFVALRAYSGRNGRLTADAVEFGCLTASRPAMVLGATMQEFDLQARLWSIADREGVKKGTRHLVPLSDRAVEIVEARIAALDVVGPRTKLFAITAGAIRQGVLATLAYKDDEGRPITMHGTARSSFADWAAENGYGNDPQLIEYALAHKLPSGSTEAAYRRMTRVEERRTLMQKYALYCSGVATGADVIPIGRRA